MHSITWYIVDVFVGVFLLRNYVFIVSGCSWEQGVVGVVDTVGVPLRIHCEMHSITWYIVDVFVGFPPKLCVS